MFVIREEGKRKMREQVRKGRREGDGIKERKVEEGRRKERNYFGLNVSEYI